MNEQDRFIPKQIVLTISANALALQEIDPASDAELNELQQLDEKGLAKCVVVDTSASFIAPKYLLKKLVSKLSKGNHVFSEIVDRSPGGHNLVQIRASNIWIRKTSITPEQFQQLAHEEDLILKDYKKERLK